MDNSKKILNYLTENKIHFKEKYFVDRMAIIGSYSRGDYHKNSDVDLLVYFLPEASNHRMFRIYLDMQDEISQYLNLKVDIIVNGKVLPAFKELILQEALYV